MSQPQLWVLAGPNGAGKSTIARRHIIGRVPFVNADDIAYQLNPSDVNSPAAHLRAGRLAVEEREGRLARRETFAMENHADRKERAGAVASGGRSRLQGQLDLCRTG